MKDKGFYWHVHHDILMEWCYDAEGRRKVIRRDKPAHEIPIRLKLMKPMKGKFSGGLVKVWEKEQKAWEKAQKAWEKAWDAWEKEQKAWEKAWDAREKACEAREKAWDAREKTYKKHLPELKKLHEKECGCSWTEKKRIDFGRKE